jgi:hypothetical protein
MRFVHVALSAALLAPIALEAQSAAMPQCKDGTVSARSGFTACWLHGGVVTPAPAAVPASSRVHAIAPARSTPSKARGRATSESMHERNEARKAESPKTAKPAKAHKVKKAQHEAAKQSKQGERRKILGIPLGHKSPSAEHKTKKARVAKAPKGATARCMDGTYTRAPRRHKACGDHGGVAGWLVSDVPPE